MVDALVLEASAERRVGSSPTLGTKPIGNIMGTVLIIDDNPHVRRLLQAILEKQYEVIQAKDGLEALEILCQVKPKVILLDLMMPKMNGYQTLAAIKSFKDFDDVKIALMSGKDPEEQNILALVERQADRYFVKPFKIEEVRRWVSSQM